MLAGLVDGALVPVSQALSAVEPDRLVVAEGSGLIRFDVAAIQAVADAVKRAVPVLDVASAVGGMGETHVAQLTEAVGVAREKLVPLAGELTEVASLLGVLPGLLGASGERVYGVLAQNNVEIRSTGASPASAAALRRGLHRCVSGVRPVSDYFIEQGLAERVTKEEMIANIETAIEDGFVPDMYWSQHPEIMCLCRSDMCDVLTSYRRVHGMTDNHDRAAAYELKYDADACIGCGVCVERCPMKAISLDDNNKCVHDTACVACGQCALKCPASARILVEKAEVINSLPWDLCDDFKWRAEDRMQKGYIKDFVGTSLDDNQADNDFAAKLETLRAEEK